MTKALLYKIIFFVLPLAGFELTTTAALYAAGPNAPKLKVVAENNGSVSLRWNISKRRAGARSVLELQRFSKDDRIWRGILQIQNPACRGMVSDQPLSSGVYSYRSRLILGAKNSPFSRIKTVPVSLLDNAAPPETPLADSQTLCPGVEPEEVLALVNQARADVGVAALALHQQLDWAARTHAIEMGDALDFNHGNWAEIIRQSGYSQIQIGENIGYGAASAQEMVSWWMNSSGHRKNIVNPGYLHMGVICIVARDGREWWVQDFGGGGDCPSK
jgi:uncharacterized protein YkwD